MAIAQRSISSSGASASEFAALHARYSPSLRRFFCGFRLSRADVEDLTQEVFLRLARLPTDEVVHSPDAFVFTMARNLIRDRARRLHIRAANLSVRFEDADLRCDAPMPDEILEADERLRDALDTLDALKPATRDAFLMHRIDGYSYSDIASSTGVSVSMIEKHVMAAIQALRSAEGSPQRRTRRNSTTARRQAVPFHSPPRRLGAPLQVPAPG